jgi:dCTP deaminase
MIINASKLIDVMPVCPMPTAKHVRHSLSWGLSLAGIDIRIKQSVILHPFRRFALASTIERFEMPNNLVAIVHDKSTWARRGLSVFNTVIEPGWSGWLTLELVYHGLMPLRIPAGAGIAQVIFHQIAVPASYAGGKYDNQPNHPVRAK